MDTVRRYAMLIDGDWVEADDRFEIRSPATEELVASVAKGGREHADRAISAAKAAHADGRWRQMPSAERAAVLDAIADRLGERVDELAVLEARVGPHERLRNVLRPGGSYDHFTHGFGIVVASRLPRYGSPITSSRCCCPEVTISGVFPW